MLASSKYTPNGSINWMHTTVFFILFVIFLIINIRMMLPYFLSVTMGGMLAILFFPIFKKLRAYRWTAFWSALFVTTLVVLTIITPVILMISVSIDQAGDFLRKSLQDEGFSVKKIAAHLSRSLPASLFNDQQSFENQLTTTLKSVTEKSSTYLFSVIENLPNYILQILLSVIACYFFLVDGHRLRTWVNHKIPLDGDVRNLLYDSFQSASVSVVWATVIAAATQAVIMLGAFLILSVPGAVLAGGSTFIFAWFPILGSTPVWLAGAAYLYANSRMTEMIVMLIIGCIVGIIDNYIRAWVLKGKEELHPLVSLVAVFGGLALFGLVGVFIGPVMVSIALLLFKIWPTIGRQCGLVFGSRTEIMTDVSESPSSVIKT